MLFMFQNLKKRFEGLWLPDLKIACANCTPGLI